MPELPEVNTFQRYFDQTSLDQCIERVEVRDDKIIRNLSGEAFAEILTGRSFTGSYRRGKYLFAKLDNDHDLLLHFGMTGDLKYYQDEHGCKKGRRCRQTKAIESAAYADDDFAHDDLLSIGIGCCNEILCDFVRNND